MDFYNKPLPALLVHHGVKDQQWDIQNGPPYPLDQESDSTPSFDYDKMNLSLDSLPTLRLPIKEYARIMSEVATHISASQKSKPVFRKNIGEYIYTFDNGFDGAYRVIGKRKIYQDIHDYYFAEELDDE